ncbi:response regulator [Chitinophaga oryziterrae]|uniref:Response regulator n=1 Tax=Chitinophaga oryziterrae TaxID=1031224 RepID=A0A6N8JES8_9BACT|nr:response regulator [Chitinophaga oryziterrae]MVT42866.1 response regulator [Chitinophaga oryziterrae]
MVTPPLPLILLIDDDPDEYLILSMFFTCDIARLDWASQPLAGVKKAELIRPNIIILNQYIPGFDAIESVKQIKAVESLRNIPILISTGTINPTVKTALLDAGAINVQEKPILVGVLNNIISLHLCTPGK